MATQLQELKDMIEEGASCIEAYEQVDQEQMTEEGDGVVAGRIANVLAQVELINRAAGIE